jgi:hypothetical protein
MRTARTKDGVARPNQSMWRRAAIALDEEPERRWPALLVHHGGRLLLLLLTAIAIHLLFPAPRLPTRRSSSAG